MSDNVFQKGNFIFSKDKIFEQFKDFLNLYKERPIKNNKGGMGFNNIFFFFLVLTKKRPSLVIESGVFKGQSTWLIENTLPKSDIISIDIDLSQREYISKKSRYSAIDFKFQDLSKIPDDTLVFFDDHVNHLERLIETKFFNIKNIIFEDNYSNNKGDFQTLKQIYKDYTFNHKPGFLSLMKTAFIFNKIILSKIFKSKYLIKKDLDQISKRIRDGYNEQNFEIIEKNLSLYYEFPLSILDILQIDNIQQEQLDNLISKDFIDDIDKNKSPFTYLELI